MQRHTKGTSRHSVSSARQPVHTVSKKPIHTANRAPITQKVRKTRSIASYTPKLTSCKSTNLATLSTFSLDASSSNDSVSSIQSRPLHTIAVSTSSSSLQRPTLPISSSSSSSHIRPSRSHSSSHHLPSLTSWRLYHTSPLALSRRTMSSSSSTTIDDNTTTISTNNDDNVEIEDGTDGVPFRRQDALMIRLRTIQMIHEDDEIKETLQELGRAPLNPMNKLANIRNIIGWCVLHSIKELYELGKINLGDIGTGTLAAQNYETLYTALISQDDSNTLKAALEEQWCHVLQYMYDTEHEITRKAVISQSAAKSIATQYLQLTNSKEFQNEILHRLSKYPLSAATNPMMMQIQQQSREFELANIISPHLMDIYSQYQYTGEEGYMLMSKALQSYETDGEIVPLLAQASANIQKIAQIDPDAIFND